ncbi:heavy metal translocating P-type ATPase metal-binding domain-containing protein [Undibacterium sp. Ji42W]|uniref:heavy metal translocating P-type ATPase metal-binding domain-containing protein n=1 Tax=Undibacterium sp. Ji42W TaxID=3413039 RepID=UPI003BF2A9DF
MAFAFSSLLETTLFAFKTSEKTNCFHCGERMRKSKALMAHFDSRTQPVCCHGCLAVLHAVEKNNLVAAYMENKAGQTVAG